MTPTGDALLERAGIDGAQWRRLVRVFLKIDFGALQGAYGAAHARRVAFGLLVTALVYGLSGLMPAFLIWQSPDLLLGATVMTTVVSFMVLSTLLVGEGVSIVSPDDHLILGFRPVSSRTYLAVRMTCLFARTIVISALAGYAPVMACLLKDGVHPAAALAAAAAVLGSASAVTLGLVAMYGWLLRTVGPARLLRFMSYTQLVAQTLTWGGLIFAMRGLGALGQVSIGGTAWMFCYPFAWFASYVALARGDAAWATVVPAALSVALLGVLAWSISGKLSLDYAERLSGLAATSTPVDLAARPARWLGLLGSETRAVAILVRSQFRHDIKFRLGLLSLLPITLLYLFIGTSGGPSDPFLEDGRHSGDMGFIQLALMFLPMTLRRTLVTSESFRAAWIFRASPASRVRLVMAARDIITIFFLVPYLTLLAAAFAYFFQHPWHAAVHALFLGVLSYLVLQFSVMMNPQLPLSMPPNKDTNAGLNFGMMMGVSVVGYLMYFVIIFFVYRSALRMAVTLAALAGLAYAMDRVTRARVEKGSEVFSTD